MKNIYLCLLFLFFSIGSFAQRLNPCGFDSQYRIHKSTYDRANKILLSTQNNNLISNIDTAIKTIPIVIHVIHTGGVENISDAQIQSQIEVLNEDFGKTIGSRGYGKGVDTKIRFCLAKLNPQGKCSNGIVRIKSTLSDHKSYDRNKLKELSFWDNKKYLNIYIVKSIDNGSGTLGYSSFPGGPNEADGIVVLYNAFGRIGIVNGNYDLGRTATHEVGHWLGFFHTFQDGCGTDICLDGDQVCDTPPTAAPNFGCPTNRNSCSNDSPDVIDQIENYMDYSNDDCKSMLTAGQMARAHKSLDSLRSQIWTNENLIATGCDSNHVVENCKVLADFTASNSEVCKGNVLNLTSRSLNNPITFKWNIIGPLQDSFTTENPMIQFTEVGFYSVRLIVGDGLNFDTLLKENYVQVIEPPIGQDLPFNENFESAIFPNNGIIIENPDQGITWERDTLAKAFEGKSSAKINNLINTNYGQSDALLIPSLNLSTFNNTPYLLFRWAYAKSDANYSDALSVLVSQDCGVNFSSIFSRSGANMVTGPTQKTPYIPDSATVWKQAKINLGIYKSTKNLIIKIVNVTDGGNNLYIDDIRINDLGTGLDETKKSNTAVSIYPNPSNGKAKIEYLLEKKSEVFCEIINSLGSIVFRSIPVIQSPGIYQIEIPNSIHFGKGMYFIKINLGEEFILKKLIIN